jgi:anti-anti-sigma factor
VRELSLVDQSPIEAIASSSCRVVAEPHQDAAVFRLQGELDATTADEVRMLLAVAIGKSAVVLDLTEVSLIDTAGVNALREVMRSVHEQGGRVAIARPWRVAKSVLGLVGGVGYVFAALSSAGAISWLSDPKNHPTADAGRGPS